MSTLVAWCGFLGAWLLFAGPVYQAALELGAESLEREEIAAATETVAPARHSSPWWWLIPPVGYELQRRETRRYRHDLLEALSGEQVDQLVRYLDKARGWVIISAGAFLIAAEATWGLWERYGWGELLYPIALVVLAGIAASYTVAHVRHTQEVLAAHPAQPPDTASS